MQPADRYARVNSLNLHYLDWGGDEPPVVLVHGLASTCHMYDLVAPALAERHRVIALDQRGHGLSDKPDHGYDFPGIAADVLAVAAAAGIREPFAIVGHSWGGSVALYLAAMHAQAVSAAVLIDGGFVDMKPRFPHWPDAERMLTPPPIGETSEAGIRRRIREGWLAPAWSPAVEEAALSVFEIDEGHWVRRRLSLLNHMQIAHHLWAMTPGDYFGHVRCPVLLVVPVPPDPAHNLMWQARRPHVDVALGALAHSRAVWFEDTIHDVPWHRPAPLARALLEFLNESPIPDEEGPL